MPRNARILYCHCSNTDLVPAEARAAVLKALAEAGAKFEAVADLCELAARRDPLLKRFAKGGAVRVIACHPRAVRWLFAVAGAPLPEKGVEVLNLRADGAAKVVRKLAGRKRKKSPLTPALLPQGARGETTAAALLKDLDAAAKDLGQWIPWFPVIDYGRCKNCKQCLDFCLFGTYTLSAKGRVQVEHPDHCKTNCPACARVCPHLAIIFPKHPAGPIDGAEVREEDLKRDDVRIGQTAHSRDDILSALRKRNQAHAAGDHGK